MGHVHRAAADQRCSTLPAADQYLRRLSHRHRDREPASRPVRTGGVPPPTLSCSQCCRGPASRWCCPNWIAPPNEASDARSSRWSANWHC
jgi:hypothetical protein